MVVYAKNLTAAPIALARLGAVVPANGTVELTYSSDFYEIQTDDALKNHINANELVISNGEADFTKEQSLSIVTPGMIPGSIQTSVERSLTSPFSTNVSPIEDLVLYPPAGRYHALAVVNLKRASNALGIETEVGISVNDESVSGSEVILSSFGAGKDVATTQTVLDLENGDKVNVYVSKVTGQGNITLYNRSLVLTPEK